MKCDVILAGVGGQGVLSIASILGQAAVAAGLSIKQSEVHGMSQRGGAVSTHLRLASGTIASDLIRKGTADAILAMEPMEALRYCDFLKPDGAIFTDATPVQNIGDYPLDAVMAALTARHAHVVDAVGLAKQAGSQRAANLVMLGAALGALPFEAHQLETPIAALFAAKGEAAVALNLDAFRLGLKAGAR